MVHLLKDDDMIAKQYTEEDYDDNDVVATLRLPIPTTSITLITAVLTDLYGPDLRMVQRGDYLALLKPGGHRE